MKTVENIDYEHIWRNIMRLSDRLSNSSKSDLPNRLPLSQLRVVGVVYDRHPEGVMLKDIASELNLTPGAISQTVDVLVREGIVERTVSPNDRRAILLKATESGLQQKEQHTEEITEVLKKISFDIAPDEFNTFVKVLNELQKNISVTPCLSNK